MGASQCQQCTPQKQQLDFATYSNFKSIIQIQQKYKQYAQTNMIGFYSIRMQKIIEKLYTLDQIDLCNLIIKLSCLKLQEKRDKMLDDIESIDLQQLDHLSLLQVLPKNVQNQYNQASNIFYDQEEQEMEKNYNVTVRKNQNNQHNAMKIYHKNGLKIITSKKIEFTQEKNHFFVICTVGCFDNKDVLTPLNLPAKKSALRLFLQKIQATNLKNHTNILVIFIINPNLQSLFDKQMQQFQKQIRVDQQSNTVLSPYIKYQKILYKPIYPCISLQRKIEITKQEEIMFNYEGGDLIGFIMKNHRLQILMQKFQFIQFANINNILQRIGDAKILTYLQQNIEIDIIAPIIINENSKKYETLIINKHFIQKTFLNSKQANKKYYQLTHTFYMRSILLMSKGSHYQKLISTRIRSQLIFQTSIINFTRTIQQILYSPITLLLASGNYQYANQHNREIQYSNYCKSVLGITDTKQEEIVQICPQILFGPKQQLQSIISKLCNLSTVGFPLVFNRKKTHLKTEQNQK